MEKIIKKVLTYFSPFVDGILLQGSNAWGEEKGKSDFDLELFVPSIVANSLEKIKKALPDCFDFEFNKIDAETVSRLVALDIKIISIKFYFNGQTASLRFTSRDFYRQICKLDMRKVQETSSIFQFRTHHTNPFEMQRNFVGETIRYDRLSFDLNGFQLIESPVVIMDFSGRFYPGSILDRQIAFPRIIYDRKSFCKQNLDNLKKNLFTIFSSEEKKRKGEGNMCFSSCLSRNKFIPQNLLDYLDKECKNINTMNRNN